MSQITVNGNTYSDDGAAAKDMQNGGHRTHLLPMLSDTLVDLAAKLAAAVAAQGGAEAAEATAIAKAAETLASAAAAAQSVVDCAALLDAFDDKYLGVKAADPTTDNDGNPLQAGAIYINSVSGYIRAYNGAGWVQGISVVAGVESINGQQGALALKTIKGLSLLGAGDISVGRAYIAASGAVAYPDNLVDTSAGAIALTLPAAPSLGDAHNFSDAAGTFDLHALTLNRNGNTIEGLAEDFVADVAGLEFAVWWDGSTWRIS